MTRSIAYLGPPGTYAEVAALKYADWHQNMTAEESLLCPYASIAQTLRAVATWQVDLAVVPVENSIEGSVTMTLDALWQLDTLRVRQALILPISHALISRAASLDTVQTVYSHPQALAQCQDWLEKFLPSAQLIPANSTTESLQYLDENPTIAAIASERAAQLYNLPLLAHPVNDRPDNCTRFWIMSLQPDQGGNHTSLAFSFSANRPGVLMQSLNIFAERGINLSRIESRPTKRSLGEYLFFIDVEAEAEDPVVKSALVELKNCTETLKVFGSYAILQI